MGSDPGRTLERRTQGKAFAAIDQSCKLMICPASDIDPKAVKAAGENAEEAGVDDCIVFRNADIAAALADSNAYTHSERGVLVTNPPYGERIGDRKSIDLASDQVYRAFFTAHPSWSLFAITADKTIEAKAFGRPADRRRKLYNGRLGGLLLSVPWAEAATKTGNPQNKVKSGGRYSEGMRQGKEMKTEQGTRSRSTADWRMRSKRRSSPASARRAACCPPNA